MKRCKACGEERRDEAFKRAKNDGPRIGVCYTCLGRRDYKANPERFRRKKALSRQRYPELHVLWECRRADKKRGHFGNDLDRAFVKSALDQPCTYCGTTDIKMTLDRKDNGAAHMKANTVPACLRCNYVRGAMPYTAWLHLVPAVREAVSLGLFGDWRSQPLNKVHSLAPEEVKAIGKLNHEERSAMCVATVPHPPRFKWPPDDELAAAVEASSLRVVARQLGCSHVAVGKRLGRYRKLA